MNEPRSNLILCLVLFLLAGFQQTCLGQADLDQQAKDLISASKRITNAYDQAHFTRSCLKFIDEAIAAENYSAANKVAIVAAEGVAKSGDEQLMVMSLTRKADLMLIVRESRLLGPASKRLKSSPDDPDANFTVGRFECLLKNNWDVGTKHLAKGDNAAWMEAAELDQKGATDNDSRLKAADAWARIAKTERPPFDSRIGLRAQHWYRPVMQQSQGAQRIQIQQKMQQLPVCYLMDFEESDVKPGPWPLGKGDVGGGGSPIVVGSIRYPLGIGLHPGTAEAIVRFPIGGKWRSLKTGVGVNDQVGSYSGRINFSVYGDGKLLWKSAPITSEKIAQFTEINVKNVQAIELRTSTPSFPGAHAVWLDPILTK